MGRSILAPMLYYVSTRSNAQTLGPLLLYYRRDLLRFIRLVPVDRVELLSVLRRGTVIWTDLDRMSPWEFDKAVDIYNRLSAKRPAVIHLNGPGRSLERFALMRALHAAGMNSFNVYGLDEAPSVKRFPVIIRPASGTTKRAPTLLNNLGELNEALAAIPTDVRSRNDLMIVELADNADNSGFFRKYGAFRVGETTYPQHVVVTRQWYAKFPTYRGNPEQKRAQNIYFNDASHINQHAGRLGEAFALAKIEYGRVDYCVVNRRVEVFEINTNPSILANPPTRFDRFDYSLWADRHADALLRLPDAASEGDGAFSGSSVIDDVHREVIAALSTKFARRKFKLTARLALKRLVAATGPRK